MVLPPSKPYYSTYFVAVSHCNKNGDNEATALRGTTISIINEVPHYSCFLPFPFSCCHYFHSRSIEEASHRESWHGTCTHILLQGHLPAKIHRPYQWRLLHMPPPLTNSPTREMYFPIPCYVPCKILCYETPTRHNLPPDPYHSGISPHQPPAMTAPTSARIPSSSNLNYRAAIIVWTTGVESTRAIFLSPFTSPSAAKFEWYSAVQCQYQVNHWCYCLPIFDIDCPTLVCSSETIKDLFSAWELVHVHKCSTFHYIFPWMWDPNTSDVSKWFPANLTVT